MIPCSSNAASLNVRESKTVLDSGLWIPDSSRLRDSRSFKLNSGFQSPGFRIPQAKTGLSLRAGGRGFPPASMNKTPGYFHKKIKEK